MTILEFIFGIIVLLVGAFVVIGVVCTIWDSSKVESENQRLKEKLIEKEYKKVGGKK